LQPRSKDVDPSLVTIDQAGFIEPFALLNRADNEIAQDYVTYRTRQPRPDFPLLRRVRGPEGATTGRIPGSNFLSPELPIHAVFISGLPKLPCRNPSGYLSARSTRTMSLDIKHLAREVSSPVWHTTCIRKGRRQQGFRSLEVEMSRRALRQRMPAKRPPRCFTVSSF